MYTSQTSNDEATVRAKTATQLNVALNPLLILTSPKWRHNLALKTAEVASEGGSKIISRFRWA